MGNFISRVCVLLLLCVGQSLACHADTFKGKIVNAETGEIIVGASIQSEVNPHPGWSMQSSAETDSTGCFYLTSGWEGRIMFKFSMIGYRISRKVDYSYGGEVKDTTDLGTIRLQPTALMLQEVEVTAKVPRITMSGDTIVFNPEAFKLKEGARLDELIKKLPGVQNRDGKLYWNDKPIRLMMNGKNLFGGDQIIGQLPAEVAKKLKLYDRKSELSRHTGNDDGEEDHVLDIQVKPGFLDKWYGDLEAVYQTKKRYMFDITASKLSDHDPQMVYAQANNSNRYIDRTMRQSMNRNIDGDGKSQYGSYNYQHNWQTKGTDQYDNNRFDISANLDLGPLNFYVRLWDEFRTGYKTADMNGHKLMSMAYVNYKFCRNKCGLMLYFNDIFNKDIDYESNYSAYQRSESSYTYLHHYAMLKFTYKFDAKAKK